MSFSLHPHFLSPSPSLAQDESPYAGHKFDFSIAFCEDYPHSVPSIVCTTPIFNPSFDPKDGTMCYPLGLQSNWVAQNKVIDALLQIRQLMVEPHADTPLNEEAGKLFREDRARYMAVAKEMADKQAK